MRNFIIPALVLVGAAIVLFAFRKSAASLQVGGIYSTADGKGGYGVVKLLAREGGICHVRVYSQKFQSRPTTVDAGGLSLGKPGDPGGFGIGHIPLREAGFLEWHPVLITTTTVTPDELEGYIAPPSLVDKQKRGPDFFGKGDRFNLSGVKARL